MSHWEIMQMKRSSEGQAGERKLLLCSLFRLTNDAGAPLIWEQAGVDASGQPGSYSAQDICIELASGGRLPRRDLCRSASVIILLRLRERTHR